MIVIKKSHDDIGETGDIANIAIIAGANFTASVTSGYYPDISIILHFCCIFATANMLPIVRDKLIIR